MTLCIFILMLFSLKRSNDNTTKLLFDNIVIFLQLFMCINVSIRRKHMIGPIQNGLNDIIISNKFCSITKVFCVKKRQNKRCMTKFFTRNLCYLQNNILFDSDSLGSQMCLISTPATLLPAAGLFLIISLMAH